MLAGVLDGGASARFERELVRGSEVAAGVGVGYSPVARHPGLFVIQATPSERQSLDRLEAVILAQLRRVRVERVSDEELERVKSQVTARDVFGRDSGFYQAMQMGMLETVGLRWTLADARPARLQAVTAEQVQAVARKYLIEENMTVTRLEPQPGKKPKPARAAGGHHGR
jgi:zinc protease